MRELATAIAGSAALVMVFLSALAFVRWGTAPSELTNVARERLVGCGFAMLALGLLGAVIAFGLMVSRLG